MPHSRPPLKNHLTSPFVTPSVPATTTPPPKFASLPSPTRNDHYNPYIANPTLSQESQILYPPPRYRQIHLDPKILLPRTLRQETESQQRCLRRRSRARGPRAIKERKRGSPRQGDFLQRAPTEKILVTVYNGGDERCCSLGGD